ncbi:uncharacterized protein BDZ99DRAFT_191473 [Mytilinidion resinicola]|uniref:Gcp-like domain-containing protein n=1 Tax=Mytilinidion resinicola TaxID=574789 RepID=A0A6A6Z351_9PEZI|nr:uncharacterized protein BDZ99DRAFT_191473 [Mytilinidion resinicola]KAF2815159.1 hypothetical protein BDZ99DRAFT_191473 [Mytilinidion resinicola]
MFPVSRILAFPPSIRQTLLQTTPKCLLIRHHRTLITLAIETSCDDTAVAVLETRTSSRAIHEGEPRAVLHFHKKITSNSSAFGGVHPLVALESHQVSLADLVNEAIRELPMNNPPYVNGAIINHDFGSEGGPKALRDGKEYQESDPEHPSRAKNKRHPDFISVTRGPGMRSNLCTGIDTAKGLAVAWQIPLVGVHHMQAHALTPRLVAALQPVKSRLSWQHGDTGPRIPEFPFLSVLVSGGHTLLVLSESLTEHRVLASTADIAIGQFLDKVARVVLPKEYLERAEGTMYGALLEKFAFADISEDNVSEQKLKMDPSANVVKDRLWWDGYANYKPPYKMEHTTAGDYLLRRFSDTNVQEYHYDASSNQKKGDSKPVTEWGWRFSPPLSNSAGGAKHNSLEFSFSGLTTAVQRAVKFCFDKTSGKITDVERDADLISLIERKTMAREAMRAAFEHLASRVVLGLHQIKLTNPDLASQLMSCVVSGGVASNGYLRHILASNLAAHGYQSMSMYFPPPSLCTDNAAMIAWAGMEMYEAGFEDGYSIRAIRKWPLENLVNEIPTSG